MNEMNENAARHIVWHQGQVTRDDRARVLGQRGCTIWMTGLSGSGKSTVAAAFEATLLQRGRAAYRLDGDNIRHGLNRNLSFSAEDRAENIRRIGEVARLFADSGLITITSFISPYAADREMVRKLHAEADLPFLEVHIDCPIEVAEQRDPKGLYRKARAGEIKGFTGIDDPYEAPQNPELVLPTHQLSLEQSIQRLLDLLDQRNLLTPPSP